MRAFQILRKLAPLSFALRLGALGCSDTNPAQTVPETGPAAEPAPAPAPAEAKPSAPDAGIDAIVVSAIGDCTLGSDSTIELSPGSFHQAIHDRGEDLKYPFSGVRDLLFSDDLTIANLETTLTNEQVRYGKPLAFRGKPEYAAMLTEGGVDVVTIANNHSFDFGPAGLRETLHSLDVAHVAHFGNGGVDRRTVKGVEIVNLGYTGGRIEVRDQVVADVKREKRENNLVIVSFHWGIENYNETNLIQMNLGHAAVDAGADLVLGHHPHVLQGIEEYGGRHIVYSLGNFVFGGHSNPEDTDSMIYQEVFALTGGVVTGRTNRVLPVRISTAIHGNDFRPVLLDGQEAARVFRRIAAFSSNLPTTHDARGQVRVARSGASEH